MTMGFTFLFSSLCMCLGFGLTEAVPANSLITKLPGFNATFPSKHYSRLKRMLLRKAKRYLCMCLQKLLFCCLILLLSSVLFPTVIARSPIFKNPGTANALATKMYEERLKLPQRDPLDDAAMKQRFGENMGQLLDPNHASILKSAAAAGQASGQVLHGAAGAMSPQIQSRNPQLPGSTPDIKTEMNPVLNPRAAGPEGSLIGIPGSNQGGNNLTLKGWPLTEFDFRGHDSAFKDRYLQLQNVRVSFIPTDKRDIHDLGPMEAVLLVSCILTRTVIISDNKKHVLLHT